VVKLIASRVKAYQVSPKGYGSFDLKTKKFVPAEKADNSRARYLELPVGIRGTVTKVYDVDDISANFPVQVKFAPGTTNDNDDDYDPPVPFLMHFETNEIEVC